MVEVQTPKQIVEKLDQYVIGQDEAKRAVAVALYNRYRRMQLSPKMQEEITPKNLLMIGPTGVGKTEIARRLAKIVEAPFVKVEATKFTEVGYVGRDVESMVRDLAETAVAMEEEKQFKKVRVRAEKEANKRLVKILVPAIRKEKNSNPMAEMMSMLQGMQNGKMTAGDDADAGGEVTDDIRNRRLSVAEQLEKGLLEDREITVAVNDEKKGGGMSDMYGQMGIDLSDTIGALMPKKKVERTMTVKEAREIFIKEESDKLVNHADIYHDAIQSAEITASFSSTKLIKLQPVINTRAVKFPVKACSAIFCRLLKAHRLTPNTDRLIRITFCLLARARLQKPSQAI